MSDGLLLVFNELSVQAPAADGQTGSAWMEALSGVLAHQKCRRGTLAAPPSFLQSMISPGCSIGRWLSNLKDGDSSERVVVKRIIDKRKDFTDYPDDGDVDYECQGQRSAGLAIACRANSFTVSFPSAGQWDASSLSLNKTWIEGEDFQSIGCNVPHASKVVHVDAHAKYLDGCRPQPKNGKDLWERRAELFENLDFCDSVADQVRHVSGNDPFFNTLMRGLRDLQVYCESWSTPHFNIKGLARASGESATTRAQYSAERTFLCPDGKRRVFEWHLKRGDKRIHFFDFPQKKRLLVGYAGPHLPIASE